MFRSLRERNYRIWFAGSLTSNVGTWMQRTAQAWIVLTELTDNDATALGVVMALQFGPQLILAPYAGVIADRLSKRKVLIWTQAVMAVLALALGAIVTAGVAELWHVYVFALLLGCAASLDAPARQAFVSEVVGLKLLSNAVALNSASFNGARMLGPAVAGVLTVVIGAGPVILLNALTYVATIAALMAMRTSELLPSPPSKRGRGQIREGIRYVARRPDIVAVLVLVFLLGTFGLNFPIYTATMTTTEFQGGADSFGLLSSILAIGSLGGALLAAKRERARFRVLLTSSVFFALSCLAAALAPTFWLFAIALIPIGFTSLSAITTANALVQGSVEPSMRGRVLSLYMAIFLGGTPIGAPVMGWIVELFGPRAALLVGGASGAIGAMLAAWILHRAGAFRWRDRPWRNLNDPRADEPL
ncbi:MFS transporter [Pseudoclavibacter sp. AY1F1]|uniref:MFS transporter n=1 Tax=Pseudoclavibacter sp. AY1F1 TaxID=2080583 RepID=UPI0015E34F6A|nr:MFS transporter [Pseudoclavibacter sp. AY1F1]